MIPMRLQSRDLAPRPGKETMTKPRQAAQWGIPQKQPWDLGGRGGERELSL